MIISRVKAGLLLGFLVFPLLAHAETAPSAPAANADASSGREASFMPLSAASSAPAAPGSEQAAAPPLAITPAVKTTARPADIMGRPVEAGGEIGSINPESIGLMSPAQGGLGAAMWKGTPRALAERFLAALNLPTASATLNNLAGRLLLTTAAAPEGADEGARSLSSLRVEKLAALGDAADAWKLAMLAKPDQIDEITLRLVAEAALVGSAADDVCAKLPAIIKAHNSAEWQKLLLVCQFRAGDGKAAQVTLDLLHAQDVHDDAYFSIADKNITGNSKQLPRQLTPLRPLTLALLRLADLPLPPEVYARPEAALVPALLQAKAREDNMRLALAEHAAASGLIGGGDLAAVYRSVSFTPENLASAANSPENGGRLHALLYQAALQDKAPQNRVADAAKFLQTINPSLLAGALPQTLADMVGVLAPGPDYAAASSLLARIYVLAGKPEAAFTWIAFARQAAKTDPAVAVDIENLWPLAVLSGVETEKDYGPDLAAWLDAALKPADAKTDSRAPRTQTASILLLLDAAGFPVPEEDWARVADVTPVERHLIPPAFLFERLRAASAAGRRGETALIALLLAGGDGNEPPALLTAAETVRALRLVGLDADALALAREAALSLVAPPPVKP